MKRSTCYIFSGLGADERIFTHVSFGNREIIFLPWKELDPNETLRSYAKKYTKEISDSSAVVIGISFGGIVAQEVSELLGNTNPVLLIASVRTRNELPPLFRLGAKIGLDRLIPMRIGLRLKRFNEYFFGTNSLEEKQTLQTILKETNPQFAKWAIHEIVNWKRTASTNPKIAQINGEKDRIFPLRHIQSTIAVKDGSHFMTVSQPALLSTHIQTALDKFEA